MPTAETYRQYWHVRWFTVEGGSFHVLYLFVVLAIAILWRPASNNTRCVVRRAHWATAPSR